MTSSEQQALIDAWGLGSKSSKPKPAAAPVIPVRPVEKRIPMPAGGVIDFQLNSLLASPHIVVICWQQRNCETDKWSDQQSQVRSGDDTRRLLERLKRSADAKAIYIRELLPLK